MESVHAVGYRACPSRILHPRCAKRLTSEELASRNATKLHDSPSVCSGHLGTEIWYDSRKYILRVRFDDQSEILAESLCTFTPWPGIGMDRFDGQFAEDLEEWILFERLGRTSDRFQIFGDADSVDANTYVLDRGFTGNLVSDDQLAVQTNDSSKPWWKFWK